MARAGDGDVTEAGVEKIRMDAGICLYWTFVGIGCLLRFSWGSRRRRAGYFLARAGRANWLPGSSGGL